MKNNLPFVLKKETKTYSVFVFFTVMAIFMLWTGSVVRGQNCSVNAGVDQTICANEVLTLYGGKSGSFPTPTGTLWTQVSGPAAVIVSPTSLQTTVTNFVGNTTLIFRLTTKCLDGSLVSQDVSYTILPVGSANAGPDATYCPGSGRGPLAATAAGSGETGLWTGSGNGVTVDTPTDPHSTLTISGTAAGNTTLRWTITSTPVPPHATCSTYDDVVITNLGGITPVTAGGDQTLSHCYSTTQSATLAGSYAGLYTSGQGGTWTVVSGPNVPTFANNHSNSTTVSGLIEGTYVFRWTVIGTCASGQDEVTIIVPTPTASVTGAGVSGANNGNQVFCDTRTTTVLNGTVPVYVNETVLWEQTGGPSLIAGSIVSPTSPVTEIKNLDGHSTYTFRYTITNLTILPTPCSSSASVSVSYLLSAPAITITGPDPIILPCNTTTASIPFTTDAGSNVTQFSILSGPTGTGYTYPTGWLNTGSSPLSVAGLTKTGTYVVQLRRYTTINVACETQYDQVSIVTSFGGELANAGTDQILNCNVTTTDLQGNDPTATGLGEGTWSQVSGPSIILIAHPSHHNPTLTVVGLIPGSLYTFRWIIAGGPGCPTTQDDVTVITATAIPNAVSAGIDQTVCYNTPVYLNAEAPEHIFEIGTWTVSPSAGVTISDIHYRRAIVTGLQPFTTYTFTWTISNGCGSNSDFMVVDVNEIYGPKASIAGPDQCLGTGVTTITLAGNDPAPGTGQWNQLTGPISGTFTNSALYNTTVTGLTDGIYTFEWVISRNGCTPTRDTVMVTISEPVTPANAGADVSVCGTTATLNAVAPTIGTGVWTQITGNGGDTIKSPTSASTLITGLQAGGAQAVVYTFRYTVTNGSCISTDDVKVFVSDPGSTANIVESSINICGFTTVDLVADAITSGTGIWTIVSGPNNPTIVTPTSATTTVNGLITGSYVFRWTVTGGTYCTPTSDVISVGVTLSANAGSDQSYCEAITEVYLTGTTASSGTWSQVGITPNAATIVSTGANTATASGLIAGEYTFRYTISATGCESTDDMKVTLYTPPSIAAAGSDQNLCNASSFTMAATVATAGTGTWSILLRPTGDVGAFDNVNNYNAIYTPTSGKYGLYVFQWTVAVGSCSNADQVRVNNYQTPTTSNAGTDKTLVCANEVAMTANMPTVGVGMWTQIDPKPAGSTPAISSFILPDATVSNMIPTTYPAIYYFRWTITNGTCTASTDDVAITVYQTPTPANAGADQQLCNQTTVNLEALPNPLVVGNGLWTQVSPAATTEVIKSQATNATEVTGLLSGTTYTFRWTTTQSLCTSSDDVTITNYASPTTASTSGTTTSYCTIEPIALKGNTPTVGIGTWTQILGDPLIILSLHSPNTSAVGGEVGKSYSFRWTISNGTCTSSSSDVTVVFNNLPPQAVAGPDQELCNPTTTTTLAAVALLSASYSVTQPSCFGTKGSISVSGTGGTSPYTYKLDGGTSQSTGVFTNISGGSHYVTVTDQYSCTYTIRFTITVPTQLTISKTSQNNVGCYGASTGSALMAASGGTPPYTFSIPTQPSGGSASVSGNNIIGMKAGSHTIRVTDANLCTANISFSITQPGSALSASHTSYAPTCFGGEDGRIDVTVTGGTSAYTYQWSNGTVSKDPSGLLAGTYTITVTDANGCTTTGAYPVTNPAAVTLTASSISNSTACNVFDGSVTLTGSVAGTISLNGGGSQTSPHTYAGLAAGSHTALFTATTGGCTAPAGFVIANTGSTLSATASVTNPSCVSGTGSVTINPTGGTGPYTYQLDGTTSGGPTFTGLSGGVHNVLVTDGAACTYRVYFSITVPTQVYIYLSTQTNISCNGASTGRAVVTATGGTPGYAYSIVSEPGGGTSAAVSGTVISNMEAGDYTIRVTDSKGCTADLGTITITQPASALNITATAAVIIDPTCYGGSNGSIDITVTGGTASYTYVWSNGSALEDQTGLIAGTYNVTVTDANGCTISGGPYTVSNPTAVTISQSSLVQGTCLATTGSVVLTIVGGDGSNITFNGETKSSGSTFGTLSAGIYIATSDGACPVSSNVNLLNFTNGLWTVVTKPTGAGDPVFTDATSPTSGISGLTTGIYNLEWRNINGSCATKDTMKITVYAPTTAANAGPDQVLCNETTFRMAGNSFADGESGAWVRVSGPNNPTITTPTSPTTTVTGTIPGTYSFRWRITSGTCPYTEDLVTITNRTPILLTGPASSSICTGGAQTLNVSATGGTSSYNYQWQYDDSGTGTNWQNAEGTSTNSSYTTPTLSVVKAYNYRVIVTDQVAADNGGCSTIATATVTVVADPSWATNTLTPTSICEGGQVTFSATISGGLGGAISWIRSTTSMGSGTTVTSPDSPPSAGTYYYRPHYEATGTGCNLDDGVEATVTVTPDPTVTDPVGSRICIGGIYTFPAVTVSNGVSPAIQWEQSANGTTGWASVTGGSGATTTAYTTPALSTNTWYRVKITDLGTGCTNPVYSAAAEVYVARITTEPVASPAEICVNGASTLTVVMEVGVPAISYTYQWKYYNGSTWDNVVDNTPAGAVYTNATTASMTVTGITPVGAYDYRVLIQVTSPACTEITSGTATVTVKADPNISVDLVDGTICNGGTYAMSVTAGGGTPTLHYQWQSSTTGVAPWTNVGTDLNTYTTAVLTTNTWYQVEITSPGSDCGTVSTRVAKVTVNNLSAGTIGTAQTICYNTIPASLTSVVDATAVESGAVITYVWQNSTNGSSFTNISPSETNSTYTTTLQLTQDTWYRRVATATLNGKACEAASTIKITVNPYPTVNAVSNVSICNQNATSVINFSGTPGTVTFDWANNNTSIGLGASATGVSSIPSFIAINTGTDSQTATITVTPRTVNGLTCTGTPITFTITVKPTPILTSLLTTSVCSGSLFTYTPTSLTTGTTYGWTRAVVSGISNGVGSGSSGISETLLNT
ncbi:MAG: hypothetical protein NT004_05865, partial [Bacteroidetes bacterium]|nr:hypothetical protein [Bacteroidota bacterium]